VQSTAAARTSPDPFTAKLRGFGPVGILAIAIIYFGNALFIPLSAILVLLWARLSQTPWGDIGFIRPRSWVRTVALGVAGGVALKLLMKTVVMPLLGAPPINEVFHHLVGNRAALEALYAVTIVAAFGEETLFRGFMFERFGRLFGTRARAMTLIVLITSLWFGLDHYSVQGIPGVQQGIIVGLVYGTIYALTREIWTVMVVHAGFNLTGLAIIYWDLETTMARLFFN
jgi:uncharacterized protein